MNEDLVPTLWPSFDTPYHTLFDTPYHTPYHTPFSNTTNPSTPQPPPLFATAGVSDQHIPANICVFRTSKIVQTWYLLFRCFVVCHHGGGDVLDTTNLRGV